MWPYPWTHVGTASHLGHMDRVAATMPSQAHAGAAQEAPDTGQWEGQDVPLVRPSSCNVKGGIPSSRRYLPTCPGPLGSCSPVRPLGVLCCVWGVMGHLAPVHRCVRLVCCFVCAVSWAIWLLFTGVPGRGVPSLCCPWCLCVRGVLPQPAPVHRRVRCVRCACAVGCCVSLPPPLIFFLFVPSRLFFFF